MIQRYLFGFFWVLVTIGLFIGIFYWTGIKFSDILQAIDLAGLGALSLVLTAMFGQLIVQAWSWKILLKGSGYPIRFWIVWQAILAGWAANFITPSMYLGGEPVRAYILKKKAGMAFGTALASVIVHKFLEFGTFMVFIISSMIAVFYRFHTSIGTELQIAVLTCVAFFLLFLIGIALAVFRQQRFFAVLCNSCIRWKIFPKFFQKYQPKIEEMESFILASFKTYSRATLLSFAVMLLFDLVILIRPDCFFPFLGRKLDAAELALLFLMIQLLQALQFTPGGLGILEGGLVAIFSILYIDAPQALAFATFCRIGDITIVAIGFAVVFFLGINTAFLKQEATSLG